MQYTIQNIPEAVDKALRAKADAAQKSLDQIILEALAEKAAVSDGTVKRDFSYLKKMDDETFEAIQRVRADSERIWPDDYDR